MSKIHSTAIVSNKANIDSEVNIGPYCIVGDYVALKKDVTLVSHVHIGKNTEIDEGTKVYPFATIGVAPQDLKFANEETRVIIGKNNIIREYSTIHLATKESTTLSTTIGDNCLFMVASHIAHDCKIGNNVIMANQATLGGHANIEDNVVIGGLCAVHQFCRIGKLSFIGGGSIVTEDIVPYAMYSGNRKEAVINGVNLIGLKRRNYSVEDIKAIRKAYNIIFSKELSLQEKIQELKDNFNNTHVNHLIDFLKKDTSRHIMMKSRI